MLQCQLRAQQQTPLRVQSGTRTPEAQAPSHQAAQPAALSPLLANLNLGTGHRVPGSATATAPSLPRRGTVLPKESKQNLSCYYRHGSWLSLGMMPITRPAWNVTLCPEDYRARTQGQAFLRRHRHCSPSLPHTPKVHCQSLSLYLLIQMRDLSA